MDITDVVTTVAMGLVLIVLYCFSMVVLIGFLLGYISRVKSSRRRT